MEPFPVYPRGKSRDVVSGKTGSGKKFYHTLSEQQLVVCGKVDSACNDEFSWITPSLSAEKHGLCTEASYSYITTRGSCKDSSCNVDVVQEVSLDTKTCPPSASEL